MLNTIKNAIFAIGYGVGLALFANDATMQRIKQENAERRKAKQQLPPKSKAPRWASMGTIRRFEATHADANDAFVYALHHRLPVADDTRDYSQMNPYELRKECQDRGIKWRSVHGKNKHLRKQEMIDALAAINLKTAIFWRDAVLPIPPNTYNDKSLIYVPQANENKG